MKKIALTGGGTLGHVMPNMALLPELKKRGFDIIYIGSHYDLEREVATKYELPFFGITCDKLRRYFDVKNFKMPFNVIKGVNEAKKILKEQKVDVVFSKGGFVAVPVVIAASMLHIPIVSHEADFTPGLANKIAIPLSKKICTNFEETALQIGKKGVYTGCPIRGKLLNGDREKGLAFTGLSGDKPIIFVTGGSLGSKYLNSLIKDNIETLIKYVDVIHSTGVGKLNTDYIKYNGNDDTYENTLPGYKQYEIIKGELPNIYACADIVISRAGANAIFELVALKKLNLLIPLSKKASRGDQILNARSFEKKNFSVVLLEEEQDENKDLFFEKLKYLGDNKEKFINAMQNSRTQNAINTICDTIENSIGNL